MLPRAQRLSSGRDITEVVRRGNRSATRTLVVHLHARPERSTQPARAGLVVGRAVGGAVTRNQVKRRLRHLLAPRLADAQGWDVVVRALPAAGAADSTALAHDLDRAWTRARLQGAGAP